MIRNTVKVKLYYFISQSNRIEIRWIINAALVLSVADWYVRIQVKWVA